MAKGKYEEWLQEEKLILLEGWSKSGLSQEQIAHNMGINVSTLKVWINKYQAISAALKKGKEVADFEVENALFKAACGYYVIEETIEEVGSDSSLTAAIRKKTTKRFIPPNPTAQIFWLKNRNPEAWKDKREEKIETTDTEITVRFEGEMAEYAE